MAIKIDTLALPTEPLIFQPGESSTRERVVSSDWQRMLPVLRGAGFSMRELRRSDAASLFAVLTTEEVARFITPPPTSVEGFERFIEYTHRRRSEGQFACFAVVPQGLDTAVGIFQLRALDLEFSTAEWGFALGSPFWGTGLFAKSADLVMAFAFDLLGVNRLEARAMAANGRGNGALRKIGARNEALLRQSKAKGGRLHDEQLWAIVETDWRQANGLWQPADYSRIRQPHLSESLDGWEGITSESVH
jgi:[ribosomal protein S5]-alanine N-acetyltransferase